MTTDNQAPRKVGSAYVLEALIGSGAQGEVWRGKHIASKQTLALKILRADLVDNPDVVDRFIKERSTLLRVRSPYVVAIRDVVIEGATFAIVMDHIDGGDLRDLLRAEGTMEPARLAALGWRIAQGLEAIHNAGVVHRDVKPANILLSRVPAGMGQAGATPGAAVPVSNSAQTILDANLGNAGHPVSAGAYNAVVPHVADFGVARICDALSAAGATGAIGTPLYMAPEILSSQPPTPAADIYSLGVMLYEMASGITPFVGDPAGLLVQHARREAGRPEGMPDALWELISAMLAKQPGSRPPIKYIIQRLEVLQSALAGLPAAVRLPVPPVSTLSTVPYDWDRPVASPAPRALGQEAAGVQLAETLTGDATANYSLPLEPNGAAGNAGNLGDTAPSAAAPAALGSVSVTPVAGSPYGAYGAHGLQGANASPAVAGAQPGALPAAANPAAAGTASGASPAGAGYGTSPAGQQGPGSPELAGTPAAPSAPLPVGYGAAPRSAPQGGEGLSGQVAPTTATKRKRRLWIPALAVVLVIALASAGLVWWRSRDNSRFDAVWAAALPSGNSLREDRRVTDATDGAVSPTGEMFAAEADGKWSLYDLTSRDQAPLWKGDCDKAVFWNGKTLLCMQSSGRSTVVGTDGQIKDTPGPEEFTWVGATADLAIVAEKLGDGKGNLMAIDAQGKTVWTVPGKYEDGVVANGFVIAYNAASDQVQVFSAASGEVLASASSTSSPNFDKELPHWLGRRTQRPGGFDISTGPDAFSRVSKDGITVYKADGTPVKTIPGDYTELPALATSAPMYADALLEAYQVTVKQPASVYAFGASKRAEVKIDIAQCTATADGTALEIPKMPGGDDCGIVPLGVLGDETLLVQVGTKSTSASNARLLIAYSLKTGKPLWRAQGVGAYVVKPAEGERGGRLLLVEDGKLRGDIVVASVVEK